MAGLTLRRPAVEEPLLVLSNREPFVHARTPDGGVSVSTPAGGLTAALEPLMAQTGGTWIAWGSGSADFDVVDAGDAIRVPPGNPTFRLRRLRLSDVEVQGFYQETSNRALWPLCHSQLNRFIFEASHWRTYREVNERFAAAALAESAGRDATVWVQDYHLACVPAVLGRVPSLFVHQFWHIPWPSPDILRVLPVARQLVSSLLGNRLLGFQTPEDCDHFLAAVRQFVPAAEVNERRGRVRVGPRRTHVRPFPISIDVAAFARLAARADVVQLARRLRIDRLPGEGQLLLGVDRIDYTKGIPRRLLAIGRLFDDHPELKGRATLLQIGVPSRGGIPEYGALESEVVALADDVNRRHGSPGWQPIHLVRDVYDTQMLAACYRAADVCIVSSLQDGMNLVAKEFVACQGGRLGVLVLSRFAGAAGGLRGALLVNPYDVPAVAETLYRALVLEPERRERRMNAMRRQLESHTIYDWMEAIFDEVARLRRRQ